MDVCICGCGRPVKPGNRYFNGPCALRGIGTNFQKTVTRAERLARHILQSEGCWEWCSGRNPDGYGVLRIKGSSSLAHRAMWEEHHGPIPAGMHVLHSCDNPACLRPSHLRLGTQAENLAEMRAKGRAGYTGLAGVKHHKARLTPDDVRALRAAYDGGERSLKALGARFNVHPATAFCVVTRRTWREIA